MMTTKEVEESTFAFDTGVKKIKDCTVQELYYIIAHQQDTLLRAQETLHKQFNLLKMRRQ